MKKTIAEINEKIRKGKAVVVTAEEIIDIVKEKGVKKAARQVDVVTTGTFGPMCSSSIYINIGHTRPRIKLGGGEVWLNGVRAYAGLAAVDIILGATALPDDDPRNRAHPGKFPYGGGHVIEELVRGKEVEIKAYAYGTDCYPRKELNSKINLKNVNEAVLFNPRNCYQNYNVAVNTSNRIIYTYMGMLKPNLGNAYYSSAGQLSPLLNDPYYRTVGIGTKIFLGGGVGYICWWGTQHLPAVERTERGVPKKPAGTIAVIGDLKCMNPRYLRGASILGYGVSLAVGIGIPIPIIDEEMCFFTSVSNEEIWTQVVDYSKNYPQGNKGSLGETNYAHLRSGKIKLNGKEIPAASLSSYYLARQIAETLKNWIRRGKFLLTEKVASLPGAEEGVKFKFSRR